MKKIILMDMDGTLTISRKPMNYTMEEKLNEILGAGFHIGILSGSPLSYIKQQMSPWINQFHHDERIHVFPCNGTQYVHCVRSGYHLDMKEHIGEVTYIQLLHTLRMTDMNLRDVAYGKEIPTSGTFFQYRKSMLNWCPIGRDASQQEREKFQELDKIYNIRKTIYHQLITDPIFLESLTIKLGGDTSFDIYPKGWNKSYAFKNFTDFERIYFIGDRCTPMGNDYEGFLEAGEFGYATSGPPHTGRIISQILNRRPGLDQARVSAIEDI